MRSIAPALLLAGALASPAYAARPVPPKGAEAGRIIFLQLCASCHGKSARGNGPVARSLKKRPADLTRLASENRGVFPVEKVERHIDGREETEGHGTRDMPVWGDGLATSVEEEQEREQRIARAISMLVEYLQTVQR